VGQHGVRCVQKGKQLTCTVQIGGQLAWCVGQHGVCCEQKGRQLMIGVQLGVQAGGQVGKPGSVWHGRTGVRQPGVWRQIACGSVGGWQLSKGDGGSPGTAAGPAAIPAPQPAAQPPVPPAAAWIAPAK
jgi:hypothetical protein